jgi:hypothetical protein
MAANGMSSQKPALLMDNQAIPPTPKKPDKRGRHGHQLRGSQHHSWNTARLYNSEGYPLIRVGKNHPYADPNGYCTEHDLVMQSYLGRALRPGEIVHHKNDDRTDPRLENLELLTISEHNHIHKRPRDSSGRFLPRERVCQSG